jgi:hypothetical protein
MTLKSNSGAVVDVDPGEILRAAGVIYAARRKTRGGPPRHVFNCRWCGGEALGRAGLDAHMRDCEKRPSGEVGPDDLVPWTPDAA